jgi:uncharacterized protein
MKILFTDLEQAPATWEIVDNGWFPAADVKLADGPRGRLKAMLTGDLEALVEGSMKFTVAETCDRCCKPADLELAAHFTYVCVVGGGQYGVGHDDTECRQEDYNRLYLKEPVIDLGELLCEQVYLSLPSRILCRESCLGLCQVCGADLNHDRCNCETINDDSPFAVLRRLKTR